MKIYWTLSAVDALCISVVRKKVLFRMTPAPNIAWFFITFKLMSDGVDKKLGHNHRKYTCVSEREILLWYEILLSFSFDETSSF